MPPSESSTGNPGPRELSLRSIALPAFGPTAVWSVGLGASLPVVALSARDLGASVAVAAAFVLIEGLAAFVATLPAGSLVARVGERRALVGAAVVDAVGALMAVLAPNLLVLGLAIGLMGTTGSVFLLARQSWLTARAPVRVRARAMSTMGGVQRIGLFVGPFLAAPVIAVWGTRSAYAVAVVAGLLAAVWAWVALRDDEFDEGAPATSGAAATSGAHGGTGPDTHTGAGGHTERDTHTGAGRHTERDTPTRAGRHTGSGGERTTNTQRAASVREPGPRLLDVVRGHRGVLATLGLGVLLIGAARQGRFVVVPLWAEHVGISDSTTAVIFGVAGAAEVLLFYPAGSVMDRFGRVWVGVPLLLVLGVGMVVLPLTQTVAAVTVVSTVMGVGNGLGSGIVQTLGADVAPVGQRVQFLAVWRFLSLIGQNGGPLLVSAVSALAGLATACVVLGALVLAGVPLLARWLPRHDPRRTVGPG
ncbi:MFS transporter [Knoellia remsis]|uniref:MFS transporter n=1 Tax=Knoellia remsis TaxID=407159 RepID=A0A2T0U6C3_9MICO|nr:MFS transporter [Knoellia remsis]PRY53475.1 MFS transporter [Knoellia remsis]